MDPELYHLGRAISRCVASARINMAWEAILADRERRCASVERNGVDCGTRGRLQLFLMTVGSFFAILSCRALLELEWVTPWGLAWAALWLAKVVAAFALWHSARLLARSLVHAGHQ